MFENIEGLGDIRQYINPDFALNDDLQARLDNDIDDILKDDNFKTLIAQSQSNETQGSPNFDDYVAAVIQADADGIRTPEETAHIEQILQENLNTDASHDMADVSKDDKVETASANAHDSSSPIQESSGTNRESAFVGLPPKQKSEHIRNLRAGKNVFIKPKDAPTSATEKQVKPLEKPEQDVAKSPANNTPESQQNAILRLRKRQQTLHS